MLKLLSWTPATTALLVRASMAFDGGPFLEERRLRERLQALGDAGLVRTWSSAHSGGGLQNYYKLTVSGFQILYGADAAVPPRAFFSEISPALFEHTLTLAEVIVETVRACHSRRVTILRFHRENELQFTAGDETVQPDCFFQFGLAGRHFNVAIEVDLSNETLDSPNIKSLRRKLRTYDTYQELVLSQWREHGRTWERPRLRIAVLTKSIDRAYHILALARDIAVNKSRRLVYAATLDQYFGTNDPVQSSLFLDHDGYWHPLVNLHPTSRPLLASVRLPDRFPQTLAI